MFATPLTDKSIARARLRLKTNLSIERTVFTARGYVPECAYCGEGIIGGFEMHEAILTRGDVQKSVYLKKYIHVRENCVLLHVKCHLEAATKTGQIRCIEHLLKHEGDRVLAWLEALKAKNSSGQIDQAISKVQEVASGRKS